MTAPTTLVYELAGRPPLIASVEALFADDAGVCAVSGDHVEHTAPLKKALGANFTDQSIYRARTDRVGRAAVWCCSGKAPASIRLWSVIAAPGVDLPASQPKAWIQNTPGLCLTNRADTGPIIDILTNPPVGDWMVTIATSGQKHVVPYGTVNHGPGPWAVRFEATTVTSTPDEWAHVITHAARLRAAGHRPDDITAGAPTMPALKTREAVASWRDLSGHLTRYTHSPLLDLALWCLTKEQINARA